MQANSATDRATRRAKARIMVGALVWPCGRRTMAMPANNKAPKMAANAIAMRMFIPPIIHLCAEVAV